MKRWIALQSDPKFCNFKWFSKLVFEANTLEEATLKYDEFATKNDLPSSMYVTFEEYVNPYESDKS